MVSIALGIFIIIILYIIFWSMKNDKARTIGEQTGFISMREPAAHVQKAADRARPRAGFRGRAAAQREAADEERPQEGDSQRRGPQGPPH